MKGDNNSTKLSEGQEKLLMKFHDKECSLWQSFKAERLLRVSQEAKEFINELERARDTFRGAVRALDSNVESSSIWEKVVSRIEQEERAELLLGKRALGRQSSSFLEKFEWLFEPKVLGASGALVAASVALLMVVNPVSDKAGGLPQSSLESFTEGPLLPISNQVDQPQEEVPYTRPRLVADRVPNAFEVDYMRSNEGRVQLLQDPRRKSIIFWVDRKRLSQSALGQRVLDDTNPASVSGTARPSLYSVGQR